MPSLRLLLTLLLVTIPLPAFAQSNDVLPRFDPAPCPKLEGAETLGSATCGYLVVAENRSRPLGRTIRLMVAKYPARSPEKQPDPVDLSGRRAGRHRASGSQRTYRCGLHPRPGHSGSEPARDHVLAARAHLRVHRRLRQSGSRSALLFRGNEARPLGRDRSLPSQARRHRRRS